MSRRVLGIVSLLCAVIACGDATKPIQVVPQGQFVAVTAGRSHACAIDTIGRAWCWGDNSRGQAGATPQACGSNTICEARPKPIKGDLRFTAISAGSTHTCGLVADGTAYCWGDNGVGQLSAGTVGVCVSLYLCADAPLLVVGGDRFKSITAGAYGTCGITLEGVLKCWGLQMFGTTVSLLVPTTVRFAATGDSIWTAVGRTDGGLNGCGITNGGVPACWGQNTYGQVGLGSISNARLNPLAIALDVVVNSISTGGAFACALSNVGDAYCWGRSISGGLALGADAAYLPCGPSATELCFPTPRKVIGGYKYSQLTVGSDHVCGLDVLTDEAVCWGSNTAHAIGSASLGLEPVAITPLQAGSGTKYTSLSAGTWFTCGVMTDKNVSCWGYNSVGQLGQPSSLLFSSTIPVYVKTTP